MKKALKKDSMIKCISCQCNTVIIISANIEWKIFKEIVKPDNNQYLTSPYGEWFKKKYNKKNVIFFHGGWGKIDAAGSTQFIIDKFKPKLIINIGTAGGFPDKVEKGDIILVNKTITYDIYEKMGCSNEAIEYYTTTLDCPEIKIDSHIKKSSIVSADQDLFPEKIEILNKSYGAIAGDWESSAIAHIAKKNAVTCYIMRGISDIVYNSGSETYGNIDVFETESRTIMYKLFTLLESDKII